MNNRGPIDRRRRLGPDGAPRRHHVTGTGALLVTCVVLAACRAGGDGAVATGPAPSNSTVATVAADAAATTTAAPTTVPSGIAGGAGAAPNVLPAGPAPTDTGFLAPPMPGRPTRNSIVLNSLPAEAMSLTVEYGTAPDRLDRRTPPATVAGGQPVETVIDGLTGGTRYYYRVVRDGSPGAVRSFVTQAPPGDSFTFVAQGDSHPERAGKQFDEALYRKTLASEAAAQADFAIAIGDDFSVDTLKTVDATTVRNVYQRQRPWLGTVGVPWFLVNGNHEQASRANLDGTPDNVAVWAQNSRNSLFPQPAPDNFYRGDAEEVPHIGLLRDYYAFTWGDALFVIIDPYWHSPQAVDNSFGDKSGKTRDPWEATLGETQYRWLTETLRSSTATHKFVFAHHVNGTGRGGVELAGTYEWGNAAQYPAKRPGWPTTIHQLFVETGVTIFFQGHDHIYVHQELDGVTYQSLPEPANPFYSWENADAYDSGTELPNSGHVRVEVSRDVVTVSYVRTWLDRPDEVADRYEVR